MTGADYEILIQQQLKIGQLQEAEISWNAIHSVFKKPTRDNYCPEEQARVEQLRVNLWVSAAQAPDAPRVLDWLLTKDDRFSLSVGQTIWNLGSVLRGKGSVNHLSVADWMVTRVPITKSLSVADVDELLDQASWRNDASGLTWVFNQGWPITQNSKDVLLLNVTERLNTHRIGATLDQVRALLKQGARPVEHVSSALGGENRKNSLLMVAREYSHWMTLDDTSGTNLNVMNHVVGIWEALVDAGAGVDPATAQYIHDTPLEAALACRERERQTLSECGEGVAMRAPRRPRA